MEIFSANRKQAKGRNASKGATAGGIGRDVSANTKKKRTPKKLQSANNKEGKEHS